MNLHDIVRGAITAVNDDQTVTLYQSTGEYVRQQRGDMRQSFIEVSDIRAQVQSLTTNDMKALDALGITQTTRRFYLYADTGQKMPPYAQLRPLGRSGDYIKDASGKWWLANGVIEDFTNEGWICLLCTLQTATPNIEIVEADNGNC